MSPQNGHWTVSCSTWRAEMRAGKRQSGLTLIELLLALALTALLGVMIATLIGGWVDLRARSEDERPDESPDAAVLEFCLLAEQRFDGLTRRALQEERLPLNNALLDWQPDRMRLEWVSRSGVAIGEPAGVGRIPVSAVQRQALHWQQATGRLLLQSSSDLDAVAPARWRVVRALDRVTEPTLTFYMEGRWFAYPADNETSATKGVRLSFRMREVPYVCTFSVPAAG